MKIVIVSNTCSADEYKRIQDLKFREKVSPQQNFFLMLIEGLLAHSNIVIHCVTARSIAESNANVRKLYAYTQKINERLTFSYTEVIAKDYIRNIMNFLETKKLVRTILRESDRSNTFVIFDPLSTDITLGGLFSSRSFKKIAVVTDIPKYISEIGKEKLGRIGRLKRNFKQFVFMKSISKMDAFCFLTKSMQIINKRNVPHCIVEGMVPDNTKYFEKPQNKKRVILYAGGLYDKFGIIDLVQAFKRINNKDVELHIYGEGMCEDFIKRQSELFPQIIYKGVVGIEEIIEAERMADILINPRPTTGVFTEFSFPSKTLEYMSSGRPVITTRLAGIPEEYFDYVFTISKDGADGIYDSISNVLKLPMIVLDQVGKRSFDFVIKNKKSSAQAMVLIHLIEMIKTEDKQLC